MWVSLTISVDYSYFCIVLFFILHNPFSGSHGLIASVASDFDAIERLALVTSLDVISELPAVRYVCYLWYSIMMWRSE